MVLEVVNPTIPKWKDLEKDFKEIVESKIITTNKWTEKVEKEICKIHDCKYCILTSSGTSAFMLLASAVNKLYPQKTIRMQDYTFRSTKDIAMLLYVGSDFMLVDVEKDTMLSEEPEDSEMLFIPTMTFGNVKTYKHKKTIYDSTHCFGNKECNGRGFGEILSFAPAKRITAGEGGAVITNNKRIYNEVRKLRKYHSRIPELSACMLYYNMIREKDIKDQYNVVVIETMTDKKREKLGKLFRIKQRYKPWDKYNENSVWLYNHMLMVPNLPEEEMNKLIPKIEEIIAE